MENFKTLGMQEMSPEELMKVEGGIWPAIVAALAISAIDNFGDIRDGLIDGWNGKARY